VPGSAYKLAKFSPVRSRGTRVRSSKATPRSIECRFSPVMKDDPSPSVSLYIVLVLFSPSTALMGICGRQNSRADSPTSGMFTKFYSGGDLLAFLLPRSFFFCLTCDTDL